VSKDIKDLLGYQTLLGLIQATTMGIPKVLPNKFFANPRKTIGDSGRYMQVTGTRTVARLSNYNTPAKRTNLKDIAKKDIKLMHTYEEIQLDPVLYQALHGYTSWEHVRYPAEEEVTRQIKSFRQRFENLRQAATIQALNLGHIYFDTDGNLLPSSSSAVYDVSFNPDTATNFCNLSTCMTAISGPSTASWATASTNIPGQIRALKNYALKKTGYELKHAFYGINIPDYVTQNNYLNGYLVREPDGIRKEYIKEGELPPEYTFEGIQWHPVYQAFYEDQNGTNQSLIGANKVIFTPEINDDWWEFLEGSMTVPTSVAIASDAASALKTFDVTHGMFAWAIPSHNPPTVNMYCGDTFIPVMKNPNCVFSLDVTA